MKNKQHKLIAGILAGSIMFTGCTYEVSAGMKGKPNPKKDPLSTGTIIEYQEYLDSENFIIAEEPKDYVKIPDVPVEQEKITNVYQPKEDTPLHTNASSDSHVITNLNFNTRLIELLRTNTWTLVKTDNQIGFVKNESIASTGEYEENVINHTIKNDIVYTTTHLNFRSEPNTECTTFLTFKPNQELQVLAEANNDWLLVSYNGQLGYVHKDYTVSLLEQLNTEYPALEIDDLSVQKVVYPTGALNIRTYATTESVAKRQLETYESVRVLKEYDEWYLIMTTEHEFGFVYKEYTKDLTELYVVVDKSSQVLYLYKNNELLYTTPVVTGKNSTPSDTGAFKIYAKERSRYLTDGKTYNSYVEYWMPYNGGEGLHDASWRSSFGCTIYEQSGSHGCINLPEEIAAKIFETVEVGTRVLVHK